MNHLMRELAPVTEEAWAQIDEEADPLAQALPGRTPLGRLLGPEGMGICRRRPRTGPRPRRRRSRARSRRPGAGSSPSSKCAPRSRSTAASWTAADRGATDLDLDPVIGAGQAAALAEDHLVFHGYEAGGIEGVIPASPHAPVPISADYAEYPEHVARAVAVLRATRTSPAPTASPSDRAATPA